MTFNQLLNACPNSFKCIGLHDHYEFWCRQCSFKHIHGASKKTVRASEWGAGWQVHISERLEEHARWHENNPDKSWEEFQKRQLDNASREAMRELNKMFGSFFR